VWNHGESVPLLAQTERRWGVPLTDEIIDQCVERYWRERDRYQKLASFVAEKCELMIETSLIRAEVSSRAKDLERLRGKLRKQSSLGQDEVALDSVEAVFSWISDLAGVRITTYVERDRPIVVERRKCLLRGARCTSESCCFRWSTPFHNGI
jgi:ppGpp synthetase/RelA/SpoT-type nucleotidyltranferase